MKTYQATYIPNKTDGVFGISLVENPAMEGLFIALSKQEEIKFAKVDDTKYLLAGLVLEPNKPIYRNQNGEEFNIVFDEQTVSDLCYGFTKNQHNSNSTVEHDANKKIEGVTFVENWIVRDGDIDTSTALGLNCKKGSWVSVLKCDNKEIYNEALKGNIKGFSVDAMINLEEINLKSNIKMAEEKTLIELIKELPEKIALSFKSKDKVEVKLGMIKTEDGLEIHYDGEELTEGAQVFSLTPDGEKIPFPVGDYVTEMGVISVDENGSVISVKSAVEEDVPAVEPMAEDTPTATPEAPKGDLGDELEKAIKSIMIKYSEENNKKFEDFKAEFTIQNTDLKAQVLELSKAPSKKAIKTPSQKTGELSNFEKVKLRQNS